MSNDTPDRNEQGDAMDISRVYRQTSRTGPPPHLDAAIMAAAHRQAQSRPGLVDAIWQRWRRPMTAAALLMLSLGVILQIQHEAPQTLSAPPSQETKAEVAEVKAKTTSPATTPAVKPPAPLEQQEKMAAAPHAKSTIAQRRVVKDEAVARFNTEAEPQLTQAGKSAKRDTPSPAKPAGGAPKISPVIEEKFQTTTVHEQTVVMDKGIDEIMVAAPAMAAVAEAENTAPPDSPVTALPDTSSAVLSNEPPETRKRQSAESVTAIAPTTADTAETGLAGPGVSIATAAPDTADATMEEFAEAAPPEPAEPQRRPAIRGSYAIPLESPALSKYLQDDSPSTAGTPDAQTADTPIPILAQAETDTVRAGGPANNTPDRNPEIESQLQAIAELLTTNKRDEAKQRLQEFHKKYTDYTLAELYKRFGRSWVDSVLTPAQPHQ